MQQHHAPRTDYSRMAGQSLGCCRISTSLDLCLESWSWKQSLKPLVLRILLDLYQSMLEVGYRAEQEAMRHSIRGLTILWRSSESPQLLQVQHRRLFRVLRITG